MTTTMLVTLASASCARTSLYLSRKWYKVFFSLSKCHELFSHHIVFFLIIMLFVIIMMKMTYNPHNIRKWNEGKIKNSGLCEGFTASQINIMSSLNNSLLMIFVIYDAKFHTNVINNDHKNLHRIHNIVVLRGKFLGKRKLYS